MTIRRDVRGRSGSKIEAKQGRGTRVTEGGQRNEEKWGDEETEGQRERETKGVEFFKRRARRKR